MKKNFSASMILLTVILMDFLTGMEFDLFTPSFPELQSHFSLSPFLVEALLSINFIGYCLSLLLVGSLADRYGRKPVILVGLTTFVMGSIFCFWGISYPFLLVGRFLQGVGIAAPAILSFLIIADAYSLKKQQFFLAMLNGATNVSVAVAPVAGSYITLYFHWQGNFLTLLLLGLITLMMTVFFIPMQPFLEHKETHFLRGYFSLFQSKPLMLLIVSIVFTVTPYWIFAGMSPLLYIGNLGVSLSHFGYYQGVLALIFAFGSILFGFIMHRYEQKKMLSVSIQIIIVSLLIMVAATFWDIHNPLLITLAFLPFNIVEIIPSTILYPLCLSFMLEKKGQISGLIGGGKLIFSALGLQLASYFYRGSFQNIGVIISGYIAIVAVTLFFVCKNRVLMNKINE